MGFASDQLLRDPNHRSKHPINSVVMYGSLSNELKNIETLSTYSTNGIFSKLLNYNTKILLLGETDHISYSHFSEELFSVPYRKFLKCSGQRQV